MSYVTSSLLAEKGFVVLDRYDQAADPQEWKDLEFVNWKSSGNTRFAPLASAHGEIEVNGFWNHEPPRPDKDGVWIDSQVAKAPNLVRRAQEPGANVGRCRVIELQPTSYSDALYNMHQDDNNRLNPVGAGWVVRGYYNLSDDADSYMVLRQDRFSPATEMRIALPAGTQIIIDTQRLWHATWHAGSEARYSLITSWESSSALERYIEKYHGSSDHENAPLDQKVIDDAQSSLLSRLAERASALAEQGTEDLEPEKSEA